MDTESSAAHDNLAPFRELGLLAVVAAYFAAPILTFADADHLFSCGLAIAGVMMFGLIVTKRTHARIIILVLMSGALVWTAVVFQQASLDYTANQKRCLLIEQDLVGAQKIPNGADLFQAFRCSPQPRRVPQLSKK